MADSKDDAAELVGERVKAVDRVSDEAFLIGICAAQVVADRVDDDQPDVANLERESA
jgi:hypothetical protein